MIKKMLLLYILFFSSSVYSEEPNLLLFGPEFTFDRGTETNAVAKSILMSKMDEHLVYGQPVGEKFKKEGEKYISPNGWAFKPATDPGVVEVTMPPLTRADFAKYADDMQDAIFVSAYNKGFFPAAYLGGGHINVSASYFIDKPNLLRNFIVDILNHAELGLGIWNYDTNNALSPSLLREKDWVKIRGLLEDYEQSDEPVEKRTVTLVTKLHSVFSGINDPYKGFWLNSRVSYRGKYSALNLGHAGQLVSNTARIEIRMFRAQPDMDTFLRQITLIEKRIKYLESLGENTLIELRPNFLKLLSDNADEYKLTTDDVLNPPIDPQLALGEYHRYVTESGEKWKDHQSYIWPTWIENGELEKFNRNRSIFSRIWNACNRLFL